jgi:hypothetical protein
VPETVVVRTEHRLFEGPLPRLPRSYPGRAAEGAWRGAFGARLRAMIVTLSAMLPSGAARSRRCCALLGSFDGLLITDRHRRPTTLIDQTRRQACLAHLARAELSRLCETVLDIWPTLWNFTERPGAEATNNRAERAIRHAVLWRKTGLGTQTDAGERYVERILSIRETCRLNQQPLHGYLTQVHQARLAGEPIPSRLPAAA